MATWEDPGRPVADLLKVANETLGFEGDAGLLSAALPDAFLGLPIAARALSEI